MQPDAKRLNVSAGLASVAVASVLVALKLWALVATGALSVAASLADSALDLMMSLVALTAIVYAARPADEDHAFGHTSAEDLAALGQSLLILGAGVLIGWTAVARLLSDAPAPLQAEGLGIAVMGLSAVLTAGLVAWQTRVARRTGNRVVRADRLHYIGDLIPTLGAMVALFASALRDRAGRFGRGADRRRHPDPRRPRHRARRLGRADGPRSRPCGGRPHRTHRRGLARACTATTT
jgi:ferrous-iron efflux pump FieF